MSKVDWDSFFNLIDNDKNLFSELYHLFHQDWPLLLKELDQAIREKKGKQIEMISHRLKGMTRNFFDLTLAKLCGEIEEMALDGRQEAIPAIFSKLQNEFETLDHELLQQLENFKT